MPDNPCDGIKGRARDYCEWDGAEREVPRQNGGTIDAASDHVKDLADSLLDGINGLIASDTLWTENRAQKWAYDQFLWLGQHLAIMIWTCVIVVCVLTAWRGAPALRRIGVSTGWTLVAVAGMAAVPGAIVLLNRAVSEALTSAFNSNEGSLFAAIRKNLDDADRYTTLGGMILMAALVVALAIAGLVYVLRQFGILAFVLLAPIVFASLAHGGGDTTALRMWANRLLGLLFAPFVLLLVLPFVPLTNDDLLLQSALLIGADVLMLRMIWHGIPYIGPRVAGTVRKAIERNTDNRLLVGLARLSVPGTYEEENGPRGMRTVPTPARAVHKDRGVLLGSYGLSPHNRSGRLTTASTVAQVEAGAARTREIAEARRRARAATPAPRPNTSGTAAVPRSTSAGSGTPPGRPRPTAPRATPAGSTTPAGSGPPPAP